MNPKTYQDSSSLPLWGVEDLQPITVANAQPLWGILGMTKSTDISTSPYNISTISQESLYLPESLDQYAMLLNGPQPIPIRGQNLPGVSFYGQALASALGIARPEQPRSICEMASIVENSGRGRKDPRPRVEGRCRERGCWDEGMGTALCSLCLPKRTQKTCQWRE